eukprot:6913192-Lingulodinium_polyedra.AAC.1
MQWAAGLRPGEALGLRQCDILTPERNFSAPTVALLALGAKHGTKVGRPQRARLDASEAPVAVALLK